MKNIIQMLNLIPEIRGKQRLLQIFDKYFGPFQVQTLKRFQLSVYLSSPQDTSFFESLDKFPEWNPIHEICKLKNKQTFVDIGANIGFYSLLAAQKVSSSGKVFAFEPSFREYKRLIGNIESNKIKNICSLNCALGDKMKNASLLIEPFHSGLNKITSKTNKNQRYQNTLMFTFDHVFQFFNKKIELIKIDTEGSEWRVLQGMVGCLRKKQVQKIVIEIHQEYLRNNNIKKELIYSFLKKYGFSPRFSFVDKDSYDEIFTLV